MESFDFFSYDADAIQKHLSTGKAVCLLLNKDLPPQAVSQGAAYGYVMLVECDEEERFAVALGCYKSPIKRFDIPDPEVLRKCRKVESLTEGIYPAKIIIDHLEEPLSIVLSPTLTPEQLAIFEHNYDVFHVNYANESHIALKCVYYDPDYETEGRILEQWYTRS